MENRGVSVVRNRKRGVSGVIAVVVAAAAAWALPMAETSAQTSGAPIVIGMFVPTNNTTFATPEMIPAAQAAVDYVNKQLKGVGGRPLKLEVCETRQTPDTMNACASELAQKNPVAIIGGPDLNAGDSLTQVFKPQGIPVYGGLPFSPTELFMPGTPVFRSTPVGSALSLYPALAQFSLDVLHAKKPIVITNDSPFSPLQVSLWINPALKNVGIAPAELVTAPTTAADLTPYFEAALSKNPDVLLLFGLPCLPVLNAYRATGTKVPLIQPDNCSDPATLKQAGTLAEGKYYVNMLQTPTLDPTSKDVNVYVTATKKYAKGEKQLETDFALSAFQAVMNLRALMLPMKGTITKEALQTAIRATSNEKNFLGLSGTYSCTPAWAAYAAICNSDSRLAQVKNGKLKYVSKTIVSGETILGG
jgi:branched-chain amino acid transport system substrate-binding protein